MSPTTPNQSLISEAELRALGVQAFENLGLARKDAEDACRIMVLADLFGITTHGMSRFESYGERLLIKGINPRPDITRERVAP
ncbi:MAG: hydroxyacid dehydrogenase, partial [Ramlibacter sp.]|nr:hydroxyacid dehydrogenase [Ramlibacter sp.]